MAIHEARYLIIVVTLLVSHTASVAFLVTQPLPPPTLLKSRLKSRLKSSSISQSSVLTISACSITKSTARLAKDITNDEELFGLPRESVAQPLALLLASQFVLFLGVGAVIPSIPLYGKAIGLSSAANGVVISAPAAMLLLLSRPAGGFADKARKPAMMAGMALIAVADLGTAVASSIGPLVLARLGLGAGRVVSESGERGMLADIAGMAPTLRGRSVAAQQAVAALGVAIGAPAGGILVEQYGPRAAFLCVSAAALTSLFMYAFLPETVERPSNNNNAITSSSNNNDDSKDGNENSVGWSELLKDPRWRGLSLCEVGVKFGYAAKIAAIPVIAAAVLPGGAVGAGALISATGLSGLAGAPLGGWLTDRAGARFTALLGGVVSSVGLVLIPVALSAQSSMSSASSPWGEQYDLSFLPEGAAFTAAVLVWSTAVSAQGPALTALAQEIAPVGAEATAMALPRASGDSVYVFAPFLLGLVADLASAPMGAECAFAGVCSLLGVVALFLQTRHLDDMLVDEIK